MEKVTLKYETEKEVKSIEVEFKVPSAKVKSDLDLLDIRLTELADGLSVEYKDLKAKLDDYETQAGGDTDKQNELAMKDAEIVKGLISLNADKDRITRNIIIEKFKKIIVTKGKITAQQDMLNRDASDDFWQEQNYTMIYNSVMDFLLQYPPTIRG
jgi:hypothetical protein